MPGRQLLAMGSTATRAGELPGTICNSRPACLCGEVVVQPAVKLANDARALYACLFRHLPQRCHVRLLTIVDST